MKHLLIILISFLLLSSPVIGDSHKGETLYGWGEYPDYVWKRVGEKGTHSVYKGEVENGKPNGIGILTFTNGWKYVGSWKDGIRNGQGTFIWSDEGKYEGKWKDGKFNGQGTITFSDGKKGEGEFRDNKPWNITTYKKDGNIIGKFVNGEVVDK